MRQSELILENEMQKIFRDFAIQTIHVIQAKNQGLEINDEKGELTK